MRALKKKEEGKINLCLNTIINKKCSKNTHITEIVRVYLYEFVELVLDCCLCRTGKLVKP